MIQDIKTRLGKYKTSLLRRVFPSYRKQRGDKQEIDHWSGLFRSKEALFTDADFKNRANPDRRLQPEIANLVPADQSAPSILDVGCGPLSTVGITFDRGRAILTGADPLAKQYLTMLKNIGVEPNCELFACAGQDLERQFGSTKFDIVTSINALDHSESPKAVFEQMVAVCKIGGHVYLYHAENEGLHERYHGMHQWNFRKEHGRLVANDGRTSHELIDGLKNVIVSSEKTIQAEPRPFLEWVFQRTS